MFLDKKLKEGKAAHHEAASKPVHHRDDAGHHFDNPWPSSKLTWSQSFDAKLPFELQFGTHHTCPPVRTVKPDFSNDLADGSKIIAIWLGHAGFLVQLPLIEGEARPIRLLFDPMFSHRASPVHFVGPSRRLKAPCDITDLPDVDYVFISHNHYDHLDHHTIKHIFKSCAKAARFCVPLGLRTWFQECDIPESQIAELDWWDTRTLPLAELFPSSSHTQPGHLRIVSVPAQHNSGRSLQDQGATLWCGWVIEQVWNHHRATIYHAGDTGYRRATNGEVCPAFSEIGSRFGPIDLAFVPIWRGASLSFLGYMGIRLSPEAFTRAHHCTPADAVELHKDIRSKHTLAMHFATFAGSDDEAAWPLDLMKRAKAAAEVPDADQEGGMGYINVGAAFKVSISNAREKADSESSSVL